MTPPAIDHSTPEEREAFVRSQWTCMRYCELCGKCAVLRGREADDVYRDYIRGTRTYMEITDELKSVVEN